MFSQLSALDVIAEKEAAIDRVEGNADPLWMEAAMNAVRYLAAQRQPFTTDDVWFHMEHYTHEKRAMGAVMRRAARDGLIRASSEYAPSQRKECHGRPVRVWIPA